MLPNYIHETNAGTVLEIYAAPRSKKNSILGEYQGRLKIALTAPPVDGEANAALVAFLAKHLGISQKQISIIRGTTNKRKSVRIDGISAEEIMARLTD